MSCASIRMRARRKQTAETACSRPPTGNVCLHRDRRKHFRVPLVPLPADESGCVAETLSRPQFA